jgi:hypothetical protein
MTLFQTVLCTSRQETIHLVQSGYHNTGCNICFVINPLFSVQNTYLEYKFLILG